MREVFKPALKQAHGEAVAKKRRATPEPLRPLPGADAPTNSSEPQDAPSSGDDSGLPPFLSAAQIKPSRIITPPLLIENLLHRGCKMVLAGGSKSYKSWSLIDLGLSVATGEPWWGMRCQQGVVLYVNFELMQGFLEWRIHHIAQARNLAHPDWFLYWNLRHKCYDLSTVADVLKERITRTGIRVDLIIVDPIYKAIAGLDENSASDMHHLMLSIEELSEQTGAAVVFGAHFSKGGQAAKEPKDRISGSGVFGRDPDAILTMTRHQEDQCYVIQSDLRNVPPLPEFVTKWKFPVMVVEEGLDPTLLHVPGDLKQKKAGKEEEEPFTDEEVLSCLSEIGWQDAAWKNAVKSKLGRAGNDYYAAKKRLMEAGLVTKSGLRYLPTGFKLKNKP